MAVQVCYFIWGQRHQNHKNCYIETFSRSGSWKSSGFQRERVLRSFPCDNKILTTKSGFPIHQFADFVRFLKNPVFWVRSFLSSVRSFFWPQLHHFWAQLDRFPVYLGLRWFESSISWKFYVGFHVKTNFQKLWKPQFSQLDKICAQLG